MNLIEVAKDIRNVLEEKKKEFNLSFIEEDHIYFMKDIDGNVRANFPSVSKVVKKFYEPFASEDIAYRKAKGDVIEMQRLLDEWSAAGTYATNMGSRTHYLLEKKTIEQNGNYKEVREPIFDCDIEQEIKSNSMIKAGEKYLNLMKERGAVMLDTEMVLGHPELGYTGQPDKVWLMMNKENTGFGMVITDWKTNKEKNFQVMNYTTNMYEPFNKYPNNALGHYYLQLPLYGRLLMKMLEGTKYNDLKLMGCVVVLLKDDSDYKEFRVPKDMITKVMDLDFKKIL